MGMRMRMRTMRTAVTVVGLLAAGVLLASALEPVEVSLAVSPAEPTLADRITLTLTATVPRAPLDRALRTGRDRLFTLEPPTDALRAVEGWHFLDVSAEDSAVGETRMRTVLRYGFEPRRAGPVEVPALSVVFWPDAPDGKPAVIQTAPLSFRIQGAVEGDPLAAEPRPALPDPGSRGTNPVPWVLLSLGLLAAAGFAWKRRRRGEPDAAPGPGERDAALRALEHSSDPAAWLAALERFGEGILPEDRDRWRAELEATAYGRNGGAVGAALRTELHQALRGRPGGAGEETP